MDEKVSTSSDDVHLRDDTSDAAAKAPATENGTEAVSDSSSVKKPVKKYRKKRNLWAIKATIITLVLSAFISFLTEITSSAGNIIVTVILLLFIVMAGILFDGIGVAVTSCDITPIVSMASKKVYGAKTAMWLVKNNEKVSSVCNDVVGDIISIISGSCGAAIVIKLMTVLDESWQQWLSIGVSALISALMVGGKAFLKNIAISNSKEFVMFVARIVGVFHPEERRRKKQQAEKKKKYENAARLESEKNSANSKRAAVSAKPAKVVAAEHKEAHGEDKKALHATKSGEESSAAASSSSVCETHVKADTTTPDGARSDSSDTDETR